ncbi:MAG: glutamate--tRNA ligase, partial [Bacteroidota bacterium]|nr:glutamate--tRNA ligase [Bacteroidota bacterium]
NFLAFLGWNPGSNEEVFSMEELIAEFSLERINKAGARFDILKAQWYNQHYLRQKPLDELADFLIDAANGEGVSCPRDKAMKIVQVMHDRVTFPQDFWQQGKYFFYAPDTYDESVVSKRWNADAVRVFTAYRDALATRGELDATIAKETLENVTAAAGIGTGKVMQALRLVITGTGGGPDLMMIMEIIGKNEVIQRIEHALRTLPVKVS